MSLFHAIGAYATTSRTIQSELLMHQGNLSNASNPDAARLVSHTSEILPTTIYTLAGKTSISTGISLSYIKRNIDEFAEQRVNKNLTDKAQYESLTKSLQSTTDAIEIRDGVSISTNIEQFFHACSHLANDPTAATSYTNLVAKAGNMTQQFEETATALIAEKNNITSQIKNTLNNIDDIGKQIFEINKSLKSSYEPNNEQTSLLNRKDSLIRQLSALVDIETITLPSGAVAINIGGFNLIDNDSIYALPKNFSPSTQTLSDNTQSYKITSGKLSGLLQGYNLTQQSFDRINTLADSITNEFNNIYRAGTNSTGETNVNFFDTTANGALNFKLNPVLEAQPQKIAVGTSGKPADNGLMQQLAKLKNAPIVSLGDINFFDYHTNTVSNISQKLDSNTQIFETKKLLFQNNQKLAASVKAISKQEEAIEITKKTQNLTAMNKMLSVINDVTEELMSLIGRRR